MKAIENNLSCTATHSLMSDHPIIHIAITDDHPMVISGLEHILGAAQHIRVQATYTSGKALLAGLQQEQPDVLLLDVMLSDSTAEDLVPVIHKIYPAVRILAVSSVDNTNRVKQLTKSGCLGYVLKSAGPEILVAAIESVYKGLPFMSPELKEQLFNEMLWHKKQLPAQGGLLTRREHEILKLVAQGMQSREIASELHISLHTVETHRRNIFLKLDAKNAVSLISKATALGLLD